MAKTWGLLKYYHPAIASGKHNWDSILIVSIRNILASNTNGQAKRELQSLLHIAGPNNAVEYIPGYGDPISAKNYDISWIEKDKILSREQKQFLLYTTKHPFKGINFYAQPNINNDSTVFTPNENPYKRMLYPDTNYRLLGLFRFWNVINYFYPYKYAIGKPWGAVLNELIPVMISANDTLSYHRSIAKMAASINDSHGSLWPGVFESFTGKYAPPFNFMLINGKAVVTKLVDSVSCIKADITVGSVISSINHLSIKQRIKDNLDYVPASNYGGKIKTMHSFILNTDTSFALYSFVNPGGK
ncbi:MAG: hypothetical protein ABW007_24490, partial [Chitinophagaceae bacterium]